MDTWYTALPGRVGIADSDLWVMEGFSATLPPERLDSAPHAAKISARFDVSSQDWVVEAFEAQMVPGGSEVSTETLREMPVAFALRQALHSIPRLVLDAQGADWEDIRQVDAELNQHRRSDGPTPENLAEVAKLWRVSRVLRLPVALLITASFGLPSRTATHWIKLARERGHLGETE